MALKDLLTPLRSQVQQLIGENAVLLAQHGGKATAPNPAVRPQLQACLPPGFKDTVETHRNLQDPKVVNKRYPLSDFKPGDLLHTPGADVRICMDGRPEVTLKPGFENGSSAGRDGPILVPSAPPGVDVDQNMETAARHTPFWFRQMVPNGKPWDYKQRGRQYEAFGNFHYGATGRANRVPEPNLLEEAGRAQFRDGNTDPRFGSPGPRFLPFLGSGSLGDDPIDQFWIEQGTRYHDVRNGSR